MRTAVFLLFACASLAAALEWPYLRHVKKAMPDCPSKARILSCIDESASDKSGFECGYADASQGIGDVYVVSQCWYGCSVTELQQRDVDGMVALIRDLINDKCMVS